MRHGHLMTNLGNIDISLHVQGTGLNKRPRIRGSIDRIKLTRLDTNEPASAEQGINGNGNNPQQQYPQHKRLTRLPMSLPCCMTGEHCHYCPPEPALPVKLLRDLAVVCAEAACAAFCAEAEYSVPSSPA